MKGLSSSNQSVKKENCYIKLFTRTGDRLNVTCCCKLPTELETITVLVSVINPDAAAVTRSTEPVNKTPRSAGDE